MVKASASAKPYLCSSSSNLFMSMLASARTGFGSLAMSEAFCGDVRGYELGVSSRKRREPWKGCIVPSTTSSNVFPLAFLRLASISPSTFPYLLLLRPQFAIFTRHPIINDCSLRPERLIEGDGLDRAPLPLHNHVSGTDGPAMNGEQRLESSAKSVQHKYRYEGRA